MHDTVIHDVLGKSECCTINIVIPDCSGQMYGHDCSMLCNCGAHGRCDHLRGCVCDSGWGGIDCSIGKLNQISSVHLL